LTEEGSMNWSDLVTVVITALVSGYIGARIKAFVDRANPTVTIAGCRISEGRDLLTARVDVPLDLRKKLRHSPWAPTFVGPVNAARVARVVERLEESISDARSVLGFLDTKLAQLKSLSNAGAEEKLEFLCDISESGVSVVDSAIVGALVRQELSLQIPEEIKKQQKIADYVERTEDPGGFSINLRSKWYNFYYRDNRDNPYLLPGVEAMVYFHAPSLQKLLGHARDQIVKWAAAGSELVRDLAKEVERSQRLVVEVIVTNRGQTPLPLSQWAYLDIRNDNLDHAKRIEPVRLSRVTPLWKPEDPILAARQEEVLQELDIPILQEAGGVSVKGADSERIQYQSLETVATIENAGAKLRDVLHLEMFTCRVSLFRMDQPTWIRSRDFTFERNALRFPDDAGI
jgi:hypothetical protein